MKQRLKRTALALLLAFPLGGLRAADQYSLIKLSPTGSTFSQPYAINNNGQITVRVSTATSQSAFIYDNGNRTTIPSLPGILPLYPLAINSAGHVTGRSVVTGSGDRAFLYSQGVTTDLGTLSGMSRMSAQAINDSDVIAGYIDFTNGTRHGFIRVGGVLSDLGFLGGARTEARGINNAGQVVGSSTTISGAFDGFLYSGGTLSDLYVATGGIAVLPAAINDAGVIVGTGVSSRAFIFSNGVASELGTLGGSLSGAYAVNEFGHLVGYATTVTNASHAIFYAASIGMVDLTTRVTLSNGTVPGFTNLEAAQAINGEGWIVGYGPYFDGATSTIQAFLLVPQIPAQPPQFSPADTTSATPVVVTLTTATPGAAIRYTTDGSIPTTRVGTLYAGPITVSSSVNITAIAYGAGFAPSTSAIAGYTILTPPRAAAPSFSPASGTFQSAQVVTISTTTPEAVIRFTTDGSTPTETNGDLYSDPIPVSTSTTLKAVTFATGLVPSPVSTASYTIVFPADAPSFSPSSGTYLGSQVVAIASTTPNATIRYTTDGSTPTLANGNLYSNPITIGSSATLRAIAFAPGFSESPVSTAVYTIILPAAAPSFSPAGGTYLGLQVVTITSTTPSATIRYTTDGGTPTATNGNLYSNPISIGSSATLQAVAFAPGFSGSSVSTAVYTIVLPAAAPSFSLAGGSYVGPQVVAISSTTPNATIRYTTDGSAPTGGTLYTAPITVNGTTTLRAIASATGFSDSAVSEAAYTILPLPQTPAPTFSLPAGTYAPGTQVTMTSAGSTIRYTTDGSIPTSTAGTLYTGPLTLTANVTVRAIAYQNLHRDSEVTSAIYSVVTPTAPAPVFSPAGGTFVGARTVTISSALAGVTIRYTTNGSLPSATVGTVYTGPLTTASTTTLRAIAFKSGYLNSSIASAVYTITPPPVFDYEAECLPYSATGASASTLTDNKASDDRLVELAGNSIGDKVTFSLPNVPAGTYQIKLKWKGTTNRGILSLKIDGAQVGGTLDQYSSSNTYQTTAFGVVTFTTAGAHSLTLTVTGKRSAATAYKLSADQLELTGQ